LKKEIINILKPAAEPVYKTELYRTQEQNHELDAQIDFKFVELAQPALQEKKKVVINEPVKNTYRSLGTILSGEVARAYGEDGLPDDTITINMEGIAGQSFGAFLAPGITLNLTGQANDYVGKGLSGGKLIISLPAKATYASNENIIAGNTCLYGSTSGQAYINGVVGERFGVRNSGATAVVEGVGDHCCEYMTGGTIVVLGNTGRNFGAGMSGGVAYVYDIDLTFETKVNKGMVELSEVTSKDDLDKILELLKQHHAYTKSKPAAHIIKNWETESARFVKVMPFEYKAALERMRQQQQEKIA
jgi:glutamate synthase domain-containing protein 3